MAVRFTIRIDESTIDALAAYAARHELPDVGTVIRLACAEQLRRVPPKRLPPGVVREAGNPDPSAAGLASSRARRKAANRRKR